MKRYFLISLLLHSLILIPLVPKLLQEEQAEEAKGKGNTGNGESVMEIIEFNPVYSDIVKPLNNFYWGLSLSCDEGMIYIPGYGDMLSVIVLIVHDGYSVESAGLQPGDMIFEINNKSIDYTNDIKGDGPANILLTILKIDGRIIKITVPRVKVYY